MRVSMLRSTIGDVKRFRKVAGLVYEEGFAFVLGKTQLRFIVPVECRVRCFFKRRAGMWQPKPSDNYGVRLRVLLIKLGPTYVKLGQVLSLRPDILPTEITQELSKLTNQVPAVPWNEAKQVIESDLGRPVSKLFRNFDSKPLAAASLSQVYRAELSDGTKVAVKVQRPGIRDTIKKDIHILAFFARQVEAHAPKWRAYRPTALVKEFEETIARELDFRIEAIHAKRFLHMFDGDESIKVAKVFKEYSSKNVLTMELIEGVRLDDKTALARAKINKQTLSQNGVNALLRQVFVEGFFHADPHPGNYFALPGSVFAFIDYGMVGRLMPNDRLELASFFISFLNQDSDSAIKHLLHLVDTSQAINLSSFEHDVDDILHDWYGAKLKDVSLSQAFSGILDSGRRNGIYFPSSFAFLAKSLLTTEAMGYTLDPEFDFAKQMKPYIKKLIKSELSPAKTATQIFDQSLDYIQYARVFPEMVMQLMQKLSSGEIGVKINQSELGELEKRISAEGSKRLATTILLVVIIAAGISYLVQNNILNLHFSLGTFSIVLLIILAFWVRRK